jgi:hypothetical protein
MSGTLEERSYIKALEKLFQHVAVCSECSPTKIAVPGQEVAPPKVLDLSDPSTPLCPVGADLRSKAFEARKATPPERLVKFYGLESSDVADLAPEDSRDCRRAAEWLRSDAARARSIVDSLEERSRCSLEERDTKTSVAREAFLKGFREISPAPPEIDDDERVRQAKAVERIVTLATEAYVNRHGGLLPPAAAVEAFRRMHDDAIGRLDLVKLADGLDAIRLGNPAVWRRRAKESPPADPLDELRKIALWGAVKHAENESQLG